tara:strand:+ start:462 stop:1877 length:1416 start_codon:yes stop_codon:yes gene_type:complete
MYMAGFTSTGPLDLQTIGQADGDSAPYSLSEYYNVTFTDGSSTPSTGTISISDFLGKTIGSGGTWTQQAKLVSPHASYNDQFGLSVSVSGDYAIVGAYREDPAFPIPSGGQTILTDAGAAYIYVRSGTTWTLQQQLTASDAQPYDRFGWGVAIDGDYAIVGAPSEDPGNLASAGSAYIFVRSGTTWSQQTKLTTQPGESYARFGHSVDIDGDYVIVGMKGGDVGSIRDAGVAYIYVRSGTTWTLQQQLTASDAEQYDNFGISVAIKGSDVVVGAPLEDPGGTSSAGSAYVFTRSGTSWSQQAKLTASSGGAYDYFGDRVAIDGNYIVVGAFFANIQSYVFGSGFVTLTDAGSAYIFMRSGTSWSQQAKLTASDMATSDRFGSAVAIEGTRVVIGAMYEDDGGSNSGATYIFDRSGSTWSQTIKLVNSDAAANDRTGLSVSISGNKLITGAYYHTVPGAYQSNQGAAYIYTI